MGFFKKQRNTTIPNSGSGRGSTDPLDQVLPAIRTDAPFQRQNLLRQMHDLPPTTIPSRPVAGNLLVALVQNLPDSVAYLDDEKLAEWGTTFDELYPRAIANLEAFDADGLALRKATVNGGSYFTGFASDDFLGTRLLTPDYFSRAGLPDLLVVINPDRNVLIFADATSPDAMLQAFNDARQFADSPGFVSIRPIVGDGKQWQALELPEGHPVKPALHELLTIDAEQQANALGPELQQLVGPSVLVEAVVSREVAGRSDTMVCWREGQPSLITETDTVAFLRADPSEPILYAPWPVVVETVGMLMQPLPLTKSRWQRSAFPSDEQLQQMNAQPLPADAG